VPLGRHFVYDKGKKEELRRVCLQGRRTSKRTSGPPDRVIGRRRGRARLKNALPLAKKRTNISLSEEKGGEKPTLDVEEEKRWTWCPSPWGEEKKTTNLRDSEGKTMLVLSPFEGGRETILHVSFRKGKVGWCILSAEGSSREKGKRFDEALSRKRGKKAAFPIGRCQKKKQKGLPPRRISKVFACRKCPEALRKGGGTVRNKRGKTTPSFPGKGGGENRRLRLRAEAQGRRGKNPPTSPGGRDPLAALGKEGMVF